MNTEAPMVLDQIIINFARIDYAKINELKSYDSNDEIFGQLVEIFSIEIRKQLPEMKRCVSSENFDGLSKAVHRFRSTAYNLGALRSAEITKRIDFVLSKELVNLIELKQLVHALERECLGAYTELVLILRRAA